MKLTEAIVKSQAELIAQDENLATITQLEQGLSEVKRSHSDLFECRDGTIS